MGIPEKHCIMGMLLTCPKLKQKHIIIVITHSNRVKTQ